MTGRVFATWCRSMGHLVAYQAKRFALVAWLCLVVTMIIGFIKLENLNHENQQRIADIQESRYDSCVQIYRSFHVIFDPFFPPVNQQSEAQRNQIREFDRLIARNIRQCQRNVTPPPVPGKTTTTTK